LLTPSTVFRPSRSFTSLSAFRVSIARFCSALTVSVRQSMIRSLGAILSSLAASSILDATARRPSPLSGIPLSSRASPMTAAPYFLTSGSILARLFSSPETELIRTLPPPG
jgi:hypothetical protein